MRERSRIPYWDFLTPEEADTLNCDARHDFTVYIDSPVACGQILDWLVIHPQVDDLDRDIIVLRRRGIVGAKLAEVLRVSKATICERTAKMLTLYHELENSDPRDWAWFDSRRPAEAHELEEV